MSNPDFQPGQRLRLRVDFTAAPRGVTRRYAAGTPFTVGVVLGQIVQVNDPIGLAVRLPACLFDPAGDDTPGPGGGSTAAPTPRLRRPARALVAA